ncbi:HTH-type transcriptional repressor Bm3R1 [Phycisphaerae bacterium RAS1]|nr:HTH-type transcriptional repressor Bm3R1 [Phycisphaerae bacterium RAS1]
MARPIEKRAFIERGVVAVVAERGLHAVTIQDIARASGVSAGLLYRYWKTRDALAADVYRRHHAALLEQLSNSVAGEPDAWRQLLAAVRAFLAFAAASPVELKFLLLSQHDLGPQLPRGRSVHDWLRGRVDAALRQGRLRRMDADLACQLFMGAVLQPVVGIIYGRLRGPATRLTTDVLAALERLLGSDPQPERRTPPRKKARREAPRT